MRKHHAVHAVTVYVGFLDGRPHVQVIGGARGVATYMSRAAARRAYADVRTAILRFDAETSAEPRR